MESINQFLVTERLSSVIYHFTSLSALHNILQNDAIVLRSSYGRISDDLHKQKKFYLSCTRQRNGLMGYSHKCSVRITLDGDMLNNRFEGGPVDYWGKSMGKQSYYDKDMYSQIPKLQSSTENEDRLYSNEPTIKNAKSYIRRVDVLLKSNFQDKVALSYAYHAILLGKGLVFVYDNMDDFNKQSQNTVNEKIMSFEDIHTFIPKGLNFNGAVTYGLSHMLSFFLIVDGIHPNDAKEYCGKLLSKYNLKEYISSVLKDINYHMRADDIDATLLDGIRTNGDMYVYEKAFTMLRDFLRERGFANIFDAKQAIKKRIKNSHWGDFDWEKTVDVFVFQSNGLTNRWGNVVILHPDKTLFWDIEGIDLNRRYFVDDIERNILSHKSKSDESFHKYIQHFAKGKISVTQMLDFLNKLNTQEEDIVEYLFGGHFKTIPMQYSYIDDQKYMSESEKEELKSMFKI